MLEMLLDPQAWLSFLTLTLLEIVLGIDNIIFLSILVARLPREQQPRARVLGLGFAMLTRILLLFTITSMIRLTTPLLTVLAQEISARDLILLAGGLFLIGKSVSEIYGALEGAEQQRKANARNQFVLVILQIGILDIVFSLDSVFTAVGLAQHLPIMVTAIVIAVFVMMFMAAPINAFIERHPTIMILALAFLIMVGMALVADAFDQHIPKGYLYFAMAFSIGVEAINIRVRQRGQPVNLRPDMVPVADEPAPKP